MSFNEHMMAEMKLILMFPDTSALQGLKIHQEAEPSVIEAAQRLHGKGIISQVDGGYLTDLGLDLVEHAKVLHTALK